MGLRRTYPSWFELIWSTYPTHLFPARHNKKESYEIADKLQRENEWGAEGLKELLEFIQENKSKNKHWQPNSQFGPKGLQSFLRQEKWEEGYEEIRADKYERPATRVEESHDEAMEKIRASQERIQKIRRIK